MLNDGYFKILTIECTAEGAGIDPECLVLSLHISVSIKASLLILNMFNIYKNNISKKNFFSNFKIIDLIKLPLQNIYCSIYWLR